MDVNISGNGINVNPMMRSIIASHIEADLHSTKGLTSLNATFSKEARQVKLELLLNGKDLTLDASSSGINAIDIIGCAFGKLGKQLSTAKSKKKSKKKNSLSAAEVAEVINSEELEEVSDAIELTAATIFENFLEEEAAAETESLKEKEIECPVVIEVDESASDIDVSSDSED